jgi:hypothetical protein
MYYTHNFISIFIFLIPLLTSVNLECRQYTLINFIWLTAGFAYHLSSFMNNYEVKGIVYLFRCIDILSIHTLIPYIIYYSTYNNYYYYTGIINVILLIAIYYFNLVIVNHNILHVIASLGVYTAVNSCYLNKDTCHLCYNITRP